MTKAEMLRAKRILRLAERMAKAVDGKHMEEIFHATSLLLAFFVEHDAQNTADRCEGIDAIANGAKRLVAEREKARATHGQGDAAAPVDL